MWPEPSPADAFAARRRRLANAFDGPLVIASGFARSRNFPDNPYPYRAESHFLYLVGAPIQGAALVIEGDDVVLYAPNPEPAEALWSGPSPSLDDLARDRGVDVRRIDAFSAPDGAATLPPHDGESAAWIAELLGRDVEAGGGAELSGVDARLADAIIEVRLRHDDAAVEQMRQAAAVTAHAHAAGMARTRPGMREAVVRGAMEDVIIGAGMTNAYSPIVTVHGEVLHNEVYDNVIAEGDLLLADVGAETPEGWASDVTRTWPVTGRFSPEQRAIYQVVLAAQRAAIDTVGPSVRYLDVHRAAGRAIVAGLVDLEILVGDPDDLFERGAGALFFPHGVGHLLGLDVHDLEDLGDRAGYPPGRSRATTPADRFLRLDRDLEPRMAVTIEPGFYQVPEILDRPLADLEGALNRDTLARFSGVRGIRIEDDILVTDSGREVLTAKIPKDPDEVESAVLSA